MADKYLELVNTGFTKNLAKTLGLPRPSILRRHTPGAPLVPGPVLLLGNSPAAQGLSDTMLGWGLDVRRHAVGEGKIGAIILMLDDVAAPGELSEPMLAAGHALRQLAPGGRVVSFSRPALATDAPAQAAARQGIDGVGAFPGPRTARRGDGQRRGARRARRRHGPLGACRVAFPALGAQRLRRRPVPARRFQRTASSRRTSRSRWPERLPW